MHIPPHDNDNRPIIDINDAKVPYAFFNRVTLNRDEEFVYELKEYESCIVPVTGSIIVNVYSLDKRLMVIGLITFGTESLRGFMCQRV